VAREFRNDDGRRGVLNAPLTSDFTSDPSVAERLLPEFHRAAEHVPAYRALLDECGVRAIDIRDIWSFTALCPLLSKGNTFDRFPIADLCAGGELRDVAEVLTSSGHGGRFSFGVISRAEAASSGAFVDAALDPPYQVRSRKTLAINCLPMGVVVSSQAMTVATTSVREDMAVALVKTFGAGYEQILLIGDPLFMKRLVDYGIEQAVDWRQHHVNAVVGEETFGEHFRGYVESCIGGRVLSSFGVAELGLHLCYETADTVSAARAQTAEPPGSWPPMILAFNPQRTFVEIVHPDADGYGRLTISMLDPNRQIPMLRYQTGDVAKLLDGDRIALRGRRRESLPNGAYVGLYKDALYANRDLARRFTGATRLTFEAGRFSMHAQLVKGQPPEKALESGLIEEIPADVRPSRLVLWPYAQFPFGMGLDYERKFSYFVPGERDR
jgi:phenylacetate-CoA ligase